MKKQTISKKGQMVILSCFIFVFFLFISYVFPNIYILNDDLMIQSILSGKFLKPYFFTYYVSNELGMIISLLYQYIPSIPWFGVFLVSVYYFSIIVILKRFLELHDNKKRILSILMFLSIFWGLFFSNYIMMTYTIVAAVPVACGTFLLVIDKTKKDYLIIFLCFLISYMIRENIFILSLPFIIFILLKQHREIKSDIKENILPVKMIICFFIIFSLIVLVNKFIPMSLEWKQYKDYNKIRTEVYDYIHIYPERDEAIEYYLDSGISYEEMLLFYLYDTNADIIGEYHSSCFSNNLSAIDKRSILKDSILKSMDKLNIFAEYKYLKNKDITFIHRLLEAFKIYFTQILTCGSVVRYHIFICGVYVLFIINIFCEKQYKYILIPIIIYSIRSIIWIFFAFIDRYPDRILIATLIIEAMILLGIIYKMIMDSNSSDTRMLTIMCVAFTVISLWSIDGTIRQYYAERYRISRDDGIYLYMKENPDDIYLLDLNSVVNHSGYVFNDYDNDYENYIILGGWIVGHPLMNEKILMNDNYKLIVKNECLINAAIISQIMEQEIIPIESVNDQYTVFELHNL